MTQINVQYEAQIALRRFRSMEQGVEAEIYSKFLRRRIESSTKQGPFFHNYVVTLSHTIVDDRGSATQHLRPGYCV